MATLTDGRKAFVDGAYAGDEIAIRSYRERKGCLEASDFELISPSADRVEPPCPLTRECGGCDWMALSQAAQEKEKLSLVEQALRRTGGVVLSDLGLSVGFHPSPDPFRYRSRVHLQVQERKFGFFRRNSHELIEISSCSVMSSQLALVFEKVRTLAPELLDVVESVELRAMGTEAKLDPSTCSAHFVLCKQRGVPSPKFQKSVGRLRLAVENLRPHLLPCISSEKVREQAFQPARGVTVYAPVGGFTQVNEAVNRRLVQRVLAVAEGAAASTFLDLYCGSGNFSLPLAARGLSGVGVELNESAILAARRAASEQKLEVEFFAGASQQHLSEFTQNSRQFDLVLLDPPRAGAKELISSLCKLKAPLVAMIGCDPVTLARDLRELLLGGYRLHSVEVFDMFPQTHHVETLAVLNFP